MTPECEAYLYAAARAQLLREVVIPALNEGKIVICDRHVDSSVAYQGAGRGLGTDVVKNINAKAIEGCPVDATVFIDLPHDKMFRSRKRRKNWATVSRWNRAISTPAFTRAFPTSPTKIRKG